MNRKEIRQQAKAQAAATKQARAARKDELAALPAAERKEAQRADKRSARAAGKQRKAELAALPRAERKVGKRLARREKKYLTRRRRTIVWSVVGVGVVALAVFAAPYVSNIRHLLSITVDSQTPEGVAARESAMAVSEQISDEGIVLLKNSGDTLPLAGNAVNVFGFASMNPRFGGGGSGTADQSLAVNLYDALNEQGIAHNTALYDALIEAGAEPAESASTGIFQVIWSMLGAEAPHDPDPAYLTDELMAEAAAFSDVALVVFGNDGVEAQDFTAEQLRLTAEQRALLDRVSERFEEIVVVINSGNTMELGFLEEYPEITSALSMGTPGPRGAVSLAKILTGEVNPSARVTDTFARSVESAPAAQNFGSFQYTNASRAFQNYSEGIYVGYRYYETRYADDDAGYAAAVQYPFGHGLSY
ncbi:MAG: glycoside hydrolase family 3 C-terminal domain-containing protein, partial [Ruaniaceae bacterium]|nr:glycoside hydrolase family 3 C-terminal domain-containing protein [Ruaniaceae bacterium]